MHNFSRTCEEQALVDFIYLPDKPPSSEQVSVAQGQVRQVVRQVDQPLASALKGRSKGDQFASHVKSRRFHKQKLGASSFGYYWALALEVQQTVACPGTASYRFVSPTSQHSFNKQQQGLDAKVLSFKRLYMQAVNLL